MRRRWYSTTRPVTSTSPRNSPTGPASTYDRTEHTDSVLTSRGWVVQSGSSACTSATASSRSRSSTRYDTPWCRYTAPVCTRKCAEPGSTLPSSRPVADSTTHTGPPPVPRRSTSGRARSVQYQPVGRRRSQPSATSAPTASTAAGPPNSSRSASVSGSSAAAHASCGPSTYGFAGSNTVASTGRPNRAAGWCTRYVSSGSSRATRTHSDPRPARPARPACCHSDATVPG